MKTNAQFPLNRQPVTHGRFCIGLGLFFLLALCAMALGPLPSAAGLPEPDAVFYGSISLDGSPVTAADAHVIVEIRQSPNGPAVASYRMGTRPTLGDRYVVRAQVENAGPVSHPEASAIGGTVYLVVKEGTTVRYQHPHTITQRGQFVQLDFGTVNPDSDGDGLPDAWEMTWFNNLNATPGGDPDGDGMSTAGEYQAGTNPSTPDAFHLEITQTANSKVVSFFARRATGVGYENLDRFYSLEYTTNLLGPWIGVPGHTNIAGNDSTISYPTAEPGSTVVYRGQAQLREQ